MQEALPVHSTVLHQLQWGTVATGPAYLVVCLLAAVQVAGNPHAPGQVCNIKHLQRPQLATQLQARQLTAQVLQHRAAGPGGHTAHN